MMYPNVLRSHTPYLTVSFLYRGIIDSVTAVSPRTSELALFALLTLGLETSSIQLCAALGILLVRDREMARLVRRLNLPCDDKAKC